MASSDTIDLARKIREELAPRALTPTQAKLYSQHLRLGMGQTGLASFAPADARNNLDEALLLLQCALLERGADFESAWHAGLKRSAEIMEWLSRADSSNSKAPIRLLAAAAYQLADFPAMALGHLRQAPEDRRHSSILREFLRSDFLATRDAVLNYWRAQRGDGLANRIDPYDLTAHTFQHAVMCIGTVCAYMRTGSKGLTDRAILKLNKIADSLIHSRDPYSYFLAKLTAASCRRFVENCIWSSIARLIETSGGEVSAALIQYGRASVSNRRALVWPAQAAGIERLADRSSFVLCTPTGSGKTTVATLALVQALFSRTSEKRQTSSFSDLSGLVLYLVPTRALAAEIEGRLGEDLMHLSENAVYVTRLYGGSDWGPTDAWWGGDRPTVLVCTFEKADALLRYLGIQLLDRVRLVIVDEAHMAEQDDTRLAGLEDGSSRAYRLEQLTSRLLSARRHLGFRIIGLSAVAARAAPALARWIGETPDAVPAVSAYRSTRQMLGRLEVAPTGQFSIRYDLMDARPLRFENEQRQDTPFVPSPFPPLPGGLREDLGPEVRMRGPTLWAALHLASERSDGSRPSVLISITQWVGAFASTCADLLETWPDEVLPPYWAPDETGEEWGRCLASMADYFTAGSVEYRLLRRGIAVHHGKMPGQLARRLKEVIDLGYIRVVIATSTLSEGVNIPVTFLLIPNIYRGPNILSHQEFANLIGRVGRPGISTEGSALVVLPQLSLASRRRSRQWKGYRKLVRSIAEFSAPDLGRGQEDQASSSLAHLLRELQVAWSKLSGGGSPEDFENWLEYTAVVGTQPDEAAAYNYLDSLDSFLIGAIHEVEELRNSELAGAELERELSAIWQRTYAFAAGRDEAKLARTWLARGRAIKSHYPSATRRRSIYRSSLSPRSATILLEVMGDVRKKLQSGVQYANWSTEERVNFIQEVINLLSKVPTFAISDRLGRRRDFKDWPTILRWWIARATLEDQPLPREITTWYDFVSKNFIYRASWGLGSVIGLLLDVDRDGQAIQPLRLEDWPESGLPWIAFWMKELMTWGTLDPVAAYLLARLDAIDRHSAEVAANDYYSGLPAGTSANEALDPRRIREWAKAQHRTIDDDYPATRVTLGAELVRPADDYVIHQIQVDPIEVDSELLWIDPAGYAVARSRVPDDWPDDPSTLEFVLDILEEMIVGIPYL